MGMGGNRLRFSEPFAAIRLRSIKKRENPSVPSFCTFTMRGKSGPEFRKLKAGHPVCSNSRRRSKKIPFPVGFKKREGHLELWVLGVASKSESLKVPPLSPPLR